MDVVSEALAAVRLGTPRATWIERSGRWAVRLAAYDGVGFHAVLRGSCRVALDGAEPVELGPGDVVLVPHGSAHVLADHGADRAAMARAVPFTGSPVPTGPGAPPLVRDPGATELLCGKYRLDRARVHPFLVGLPELVHLPAERVAAHPQLGLAMGLLRAEIEDRRPGAQAALTGLLDLLLVYLLRARPVAEAPTGGWDAALADPVVSVALRVLHADPAASWTAESLARAAGVSRATLTRRFTAGVGRPPMAYLTWWRLTSGALRLRTSTEPLAAVARAVGYGGPYAFSHAFTREFGVTPGRYRARAAAAGGEDLAA
ncbi:cupin domain-containing protein [Streptomyces sp. BI20]|uniref:cupin domain-containing protein n=1 Tax=Streptomyces sp. BI20 TaxID=3403460 RepID=UPI003C70DCB0